MSWPRILIYYVLAGAIFLHLYNYEKARIPAGQLEQKTDTPFVDALAADIDRVRLERGDLDLDFVRRDGRWKVESPAGVNIGPDLLSAVLDTLTTIPPIEVLGASEGAVDQYGLLPPRSRIRMDRAGEIVATVVFGERNPTRTAVYAKKSGEDRIYLLGLNASYYLDLVFEQARQELAATAPAGEDTVAPATEDTAAPQTQGAPSGPSGEAVGEPAAAPHRGLPLPGAAAPDSARRSSP